MATARQIQTRIDLWLTTWYPSFLALQEAYLARARRYFIGTNTSSRKPVDNEDVTPDRKDVRLPNVKQIETWAEFMSIPATLPANVSCTWYRTPRNGDGFELIISFEDASGNTYQRHINNGPEKYREKSWYLINNRI